MEFIRNIDWRYFMDWVVFTTCVVLIITVVFDIIKSAKDKKGLTDEHKLRKEEHQRMDDTVKEKFNQVQHTLETENFHRTKAYSDIYKSVNHIDKIIYSEIQKNNIYQNNLTAEQKELKQYIQSISSLMKETERLQTLSINQQKEIITLKQENLQLQEQLHTKHGHVKAFPLLNTVHFYDKIKKNLPFSLWALWGYRE